MTRVQLTVRIRDMPFDGRRTDLQGVGDLLIPQAGRDEAQNLQLSRRERLNDAWRIRGRSRHRRERFRRGRVECGEYAPCVLPGESASGRMPKEIVHARPFIQKDSQEAFGLGQRECSVR